MAIKIVYSQIANNDLYEIYKFIRQFKRPRLNLNNVSVYVNYL
jgi:hypothetical protein